MLKIKDNVYLKELERYGFITDDDEWYMIDISGAYVYIKPLSREIVLKSYRSSSFADITVIYDLIKADLVEVVEEND